MTEREPDLHIRLAHSEQDILACYALMRELRPHIAEEQFPERIRRQMEQGYRLAFIADVDGPVALAGFRLGENLAWGRFLYVDDLVTLPGQRSRGHGRQLLNWLRAHARDQGCAQLHLDSGLQRKEAHRFYEREGLDAVSLHFAVTIP